MKDDHRLQRNAGRANPTRMRLELRLAEQLRMHAVLVHGYLHTNITRGNTAKYKLFTQQTPILLRALISSLMGVVLRVFPS